MTTIRTLENITTNELLEVFNSSFTDYIVPFHLTSEQLEDKIKSDCINLKLSAGAFEDNNLIGFILHACNTIDNVKIAYNAGTGVIPTRRGNKMTKQLYEYILPILRSENIDRVLLEVITDNKPALTTYENIGFETIRKLNCYRGAIRIKTVQSDLKISELEYYDWQKLQSFWDWKPTWQNSIPAIENLKPNNISIAISKPDRLLGYLILNPKNKRIQQFSVDKNYRNKGIGKQLFNYISSHYEHEIALINIDDSSENTSKFLSHIGLKHFISQFEMELKVNNNYR